jgi:hypothetical protein
LVCPTAGADQPQSDAVIRAEGRSRHEIRRNQRATGKGRVSEKPTPVVQRPLIYPEHDSLLDIAVYRPLSS